jgi:hypothetical protein
MFDQWISQALALGAQYNVNPLLFAIIYLGGIPLFFGVSAWMAYRFKHKQSITWQVILLGYLLIQPYLYVIIFGQGVPIWVYAAIIALIGGGALSLRKKITGLSS